MVFENNHFLHSFFHRPRFGRSVEQMLPIGLKAFGQGMFLKKKHVFVNSVASVLEAVKSEKKSLDI